MVEERQITQIQGNLKNFFKIPTNTKNNNSDWCMYNNQWFKSCTFVVDSNNMENS